MSKIENSTSSLVRVPFYYNTYIYTEFTSVKSPYAIDSILIAPEGSQPTNEVLYFANGSNIVFNHTANPNEVIDFIEQNFLLGVKTSGPVY